MKRFFNHSWQGKRQLHWIAVILLLVSLGLACFAFSRPSFLNHTRLVNTIHIDTSYQLEERVKPNLLYPDGTTLHPKKTLTTAFADQFIIHVRTKIRSDKPVQIKGSYHPTLMIKAGDLWKKSFPLKASQSFHRQCEQCMVSDTFQIRAKYLFGYLDKVQTKLHLTPSSYEFDVDPHLQGKVVYNGVSFNLNDGGGLVFTRERNRLTLQGHGSPLTINKSYPIKKIIKVANPIRFDGITLANGDVRLSASIAALVFLFLFLLTFDYGKNDRPLYKELDQRYRKLFIPVKNQLRLEEGVELELGAFRPLLMIAEERERPICRYETGGEVLYFVADDPHVYYYPVPKTISADEEEDQ